MRQGKLVTVILESVKFLEQQKVLIVVNLAEEPEKCWVIMKFSKSVKENLVITKFGGGAKNGIWLWHEIWCRCHIKPCVI